MELMAINRAIDETFGKKENWTQREMDLYELFCNKLNKYKARAVAYKNYSGDRKEIIKNIEEQPWYDNCKNKSIINELINAMEVLEYDVGDDILVLKIRFNVAHPFLLIVNCQHNIDFTKYYIYLERAENKGYITYLNSVTHKAKELPEYNKINNICNIDRYDLIHITSELLHFYDSRGLTKGLHMGKNYPVTLQYLASVTS